MQDSILFVHMLLTAYSFIIALTVNTLILQPYSRCDCPWLIKWLLGYEEFIADKDRENTDNKIKEYLQGTNIMHFSEI